VIIIPTSRCLWVAAVHVSPAAWRNRVIKENAA
jgi:hypothetical protein